MTRNALAENVWLKLLSRLSMLAITPLFLVTVWFAMQWLDQRFAPIGTLDNRVAALEVLVPAMQSHLLVLDNSILNGKADRMDFQRQTGDQLDRVEADQKSMSNDIASIKATIDALRSRLIANLAP